MLLNCSNELKATVATILLALLLLPFGGSYLFLGLEKSKAKKQAAVAMANVENPVEIIELAISKADIKTDVRWEHAREFEYKGQMYDIIDQKEKGDTIYFNVYWDKLETMVNHKLNELIALHLKGKSDQNDDSQLVVSLFKAIYLSPDFQTKALGRPIMVSPNFEYFNFYTPLTLGFEGPPPRFRA